MWRNIGRIVAEFWKLSQKRWRDSPINDATCSIYFLREVLRQNVEFALYRIKCTEQRYNVNLKSIVFRWPLFLGRFPERFPGVVQIIVCANIAPYNNPSGSRTVQIIVSIYVPPYNTPGQSGSRNGSRSGSRELLRLKYVQIYPHTIIWTERFPERFPEPFPGVVQIIVSANISHTIVQAVPERFRSL